MSSNAPPFTFGIYRSLERLKQLVNNEYLSDVAFKVGSTGQLIHAHKMIITMASEVFFVQFNGSFAEGTETNSRENPVVIKDVEPETFLMLMEYFYCDQIELTSQNVLGVYYASQKYMLQELIERCETFFGTSIDDSNALTILDENHRHKFPAIDEKCLAVIQENPLKFFKLEFFLQIDQRTMKLIASLQTMNCYKEHVVDAIDKWRQANHFKGSKIVPKLKSVMYQKLNSFSSFTVSPKITSCLTLNVSKPLKLYGVGIYIGTHQPGTEGGVSLKLDIKGTNTVSVSEIVHLKPEIYVHEVLFERVTIDRKGSITMSVQSQSGKQNLICFNSFVPVQTLGAVLLSTSVYESSQDGSYYDYGQSSRHCISYLLYSK